MTAPNAALAYAVLDHIDAHPQLWDQGVYIGKADCGTVACFAGWACLLSGEEPSYYYGGTATDMVTVDGAEQMHAGGRAEELLRASRYLHEDEDSEEDLFASENTREDLDRLVAEIFGPRPDAAS